MGRADTVCVVMERRVGSPASLYGVFTTEAAARADYGEEDRTYRVSFVVVPLWGPR